MDTEIETADELPTTVQLGARTFEITPPGYTARWEVVRAYSGNAHRALAAALGLCLGGRLARMLEKQGGQPVTYEGCGCDPLVYGGRVIDALIAQRIELPQILAAGGVAFRHCAAALITEQEIEASAKN